MHLWLQAVVAMFAAVGTSDDVAVGYAWSLTPKQNVVVCVCQLPSATQVTVEHDVAHVNNDKQLLKGMLPVF